MEHAKTGFGSMAARAEAGKKSLLSYASGA
jgi:hypothetical protein